MDLGAYAQINDLKSIMANNDINIPRLRGLRLMSNEQPFSKDNMKKEAEMIGLYACESACESDFICNPCSFELSARTDKLKHKYLFYKKQETLNPLGIRWDAIHGRKRKLFKYNMKMAERRVIKNRTVFNKYCGRTDILYIHARIGGGNWPYYRKNVENQPWFIEKVDDCFDSTYCDIYAKINPSSEIEKE